MKDVFIGGQYVLDGFSLMFKPCLRLYVILPLFINISLFVVMFLFLSSWMQELNHWFMQFLPNWLQWLSVFLWVFFIFAFFGVIIFTFTLFANILSSPFNSLLSEQVQIYLESPYLIKRSLWDDIKDLPRSLSRQFQIIFYYLPKAIGILLLFFVPIVQVLASLISFVFHAWFLTLTYLDYPTDNQRMPIAKVKLWMRHRRLKSLGFGCCVLTFSLIPFINCFIMPAAVIGATKWWVEEGKLEANL